MVIDEFRTKFEHFWMLCSQVIALIVHQHNHKQQSGLLSLHRALKFRAGMPNVAYI